jgi:glycosyltransferase involved in cell wall biosynthesis
VDVSTERRVLHRAERIVAVTPDYTEDFRRLAPQRNPSHFVTITNGYDEADFAQRDSLPLPWEGNGKVTLAHVGYVFPGTAIPFLAALAQLGDAAQRLRVVFIGGLAGPDAQWLREHPVPVEVQRTERVPHAQAIEAMRAAHAVLMLVGNGPDWRGHYPGKLFEYMRCGTPILLSGPEGAAARLVRESSTGCPVSAGDVGATAEAIRSLVADPVAFRARHYHPDQAVVARHERRELTRQLAGVFNELTGEASQ